MQARMAFFYNDKLCVQKGQKNCEEIVDNFVLFGIFAHSS